MAEVELSLEEQVLPPPQPGVVYRIAAAGAVTTLVALILGQATGEAGPSFLSTVRILLVASGLLLAGSAISMRSSLPFVWFIAAFAFGFAYLGLPAHWDSGRLVAGVGSGVSLAGTLLTALPLTFRCAILSAMAIFHFGGIFCATTWPDPAPWTTHQLGTRVYLPYLMFMYLQNAYHFYSPDPGPASLIFALVKYDDIDPATKKQRGEWFVLPNRATDYKDPLGLTYFRRLSITEQLASAMPPLNFNFETPEVVQRRRQATGGLGGIPNYPEIPLAPDEYEPQATQYRVPRPDISRYLLPSYANYILKSHSTPEVKAVSVKIYRLEHKIVPASVWAQTEFPIGPNHPSTFRSYYFGEYARNPETGKVELVDSQDPLLYWLVPILPVPARPGDPEGKTYIDFMSKHAGYVFDWSNRKP
ncbi:hypothetical protein BH11PLA2_BH11PLA2_04010 [soil metagenome]